MSIDNEALDTVRKVVGVCQEWQHSNNEEALKLDAEGLADADEFGMHTLTAGVLRLWHLYNYKLIVQPDFEMQRHFGIIAGESALWQKRKNRTNQGTEGDALFALDALTMAYLRLYKEVLDRGILRPPTTRLNSTTIH